MKSFAVISLLASAVYAQSSVSTTATADPLIPTGISSGCTSFLNSLDVDSSLLGCTSTLVGATSIFGPGGNATSNATSTTINTALNTLCGATSSCSSNLLRTKLTSFYAACQQELTTHSNPAVLRTYDVLYALTPLLQSVCSKSDNGQYCVLALANSTGNTTASNYANKAVNAGDNSSGNSLPSSNILWVTTSLTTGLGRRDETVYANVTTFQHFNILYLFLSSSLTSSTLCVSCTKSVLNSYITFESSIPYAPGLAQSPLMSGQTALYAAVQNLCGTGFLSGSVQAAGGLSGGIGGTSSGAMNVAADYRALSVALLSAILGVYATL